MYKTLSFYINNIVSFCVFYNYDIPEILRINLVKKSVRFLDLKITEENITEIKIPKDLL